jgi:chitin synthase
MLLDAGTVPSPTALLRLYSDMEYDPQVGGCCGEITVDAMQRSVSSPIVMAQHFEYTMAK